MNGCCVQSTHLGQQVLLRMVSHVVGLAQRQVDIDDHISLGAEHIGSGMFTTGLLGVGNQYIDGTDSEVRDNERLKRVSRETAPAMRDAVINDFAFEPADLARVATPELIDRIMTNALGIRLGDFRFVRQVVDDLRPQAICVPERLHDARISIRLTKRKRAAIGPRMFVVVIRWEYELRPVYSTRRFACLSDPD
jgi:hypothetical protein